MSYKAMRWAWGIDLPHTAKLVLLKLADSANEEEDFTCYPSIACLAHFCQVSRPTIISHVQTLSDLKLITKTQRRNPNKTTFYRVNWDVPLPDHLRIVPWAEVKRFNSPGVKEFNTKQEGIKQEGKELPSVVPSEPDGPRKPAPVFSARKPQPVENEFANMVSDRVGAYSPPAPPKTVQLTKEISAVVEKWGQIARVHGPTTKVLRDGVKSIKALQAGTFFKGKDEYLKWNRAYSESEILRALEAFDLKRNSVDHQPRDKTFLKTLNLPDFFYSAYVRNGNGDKGKSFFIECLTEEARPAVERERGLSDFVQEQYGSATGRSLTVAAAARISNKLMRYWKEKGEWLRDRHSISSPKRLVVNLFNMLTDRRGGDWDAGNVLSIAALDTFEAHLKEQR